MHEQSESRPIAIDLRGKSAEADCLDGLVAFPLAVARMRIASDPMGELDPMAEHVRKAFAALSKAGGDVRIVASAAADRLYRHAAELSVLDNFTRAYVGVVIQDTFARLRLHGATIYYILDNTIRADRFELLVELFQGAGVTVVSPRVHGPDWAGLRGRIWGRLSIGLHVAYVEPDASSNHLEAAQELSRQVPCIATFRNLAPEDPRLQILAYELRKGG